MGGHMQGRQAHSLLCFSILGLGCTHPVVAVRQSIHGTAGDPSRRDTEEIVRMQSKHEGRYVRRGGADP